MPLPTEIALKHVEEYKKEVDALMKKDYDYRDNSSNELESRIRGFIKNAFDDKEVKLKSFNASLFYYDDTLPDDHFERLTIVKNFLIEYKEEIKLSQHLTQAKTLKPINNSKMDKKVAQIEEKKAESERRGAVVESKIHGASIEIIDQLRKQLKEKDTITQELKQIKQDIADIKAILEEKKE